MLEFVQQIDDMLFSGMFEARTFKILEDGEFFVAFWMRLV